MIRNDRAAVTELLAFYSYSDITKKVTVACRDFYSLSYRYSGSVSFRVGEDELLSEAGSVTFMPKNLGYETSVIEGTRMAVVHFKLDRDIDFRNPGVLSVGDRGVRMLFEELIGSFRVDAPVDFKCMAIFYELLGRLETLAPREIGERVPLKIELAREKMVERFSDPLFSVGLLAEELSVSTSYLRREFSRAYGKSPVSFLRDMRIGNAKNLLQSEYLSVSQIAEQCGFSGSSYFIQIFHKTVGESPDKYRQRMLTVAGERRPDIKG